MDTNIGWAEKKISEANGKAKALETLARKLAIRADFNCGNYRKNGKTLAQLRAIAFAYELPVVDDEEYLEASGDKYVADLILTISDIETRLSLVLHYIKCNEPLEGTDSLEELLDNMKEMVTAASALESLLIARGVRP